LDQQIIIKENAIKVACDVATQYEYFAPMGSMMQCLDEHSDGNVP
jgi:hypothetical protein